jgi:hypothetical protein|tara:strand:- start:230 stop:616 length:387 start_codon:yes stop_codon:yes gene_type:complete
MCLRNRGDVMLDYYENKLEERKREWWEWHKQNPKVWERFRDYTLEAIRSGRKNYSQWAVINRIRWNEEIETKGGDFKISNNYISFYARLFHAKYPEHKDFFKLKPLKEEKEIQELKSKGYDRDTGLFL